jgi:hypothetical protein
MVSTGTNQCASPLELREFLPTVQLTLSFTIYSLDLVGGVFEGYLNEYDSSGWQNYGPVAARYVKLHDFNFRVRFSPSCLAVMTHYYCDIVWYLQGSSGPRSMRVGIIANVPSQSGSNNAGCFQCPFMATLQNMFRTDALSSMFVRERFKRMPSKIPEQLQLVNRHSNVFHPRRRVCRCRGWSQQEISLFYI